MSKYGVNVPKGAPVSSVEEVRKVIQDVFPKENEVILPAIRKSRASRDLFEYEG